MLGDSVQPQHVASPHYTLLRTGDVTGVHWATQVHVGDLVLRWGVELSFTTKHGDHEGTDTDPTCWYIIRLVDLKRQQYKKVGTEDEVSVTWFPHRGKHSKYSFEYRRTKNVKRGRGKGTMTYEVVEDALGRLVLSELKLHRARRRSLDSYYDGGWVNEKTAYALIRTMTTRMRF